MRRGAGVPPVQSHGQDGRATMGETPGPPFTQRQAQLFCAAGGAKATAASVVSRRKVKVSCK